MVISISREKLEYLQISAVCGWMSSDLFSPNLCLSSECFLIYFTLYLKCIISLSEPFERSFILFSVSCILHLLLKIKVVSFLRLIKLVTILCCTGPELSNEFVIHFIYVCD